MARTLELAEELHSLGCDAAGDLCEHALKAAHQRALTELAARRGADALGLATHERDLMRALVGLARSQPTVEGRDAARREAWRAGERSLARLARTHRALLAHAEAEAGRLNRCGKGGTGGGTGGGRGAAPAPSRQEGSGKVQGRFSTPGARGAAPAPRAVDAPALELHFVLDALDELEVVTAEIAREIQTRPSARPGAAPPKTGVAQEGGAVAAAASPAERAAQCLDELSTCFRVWLRAEVPCEASSRLVSLPTPPS